MKADQLTREELQRIEDDARCGEISNADAKALLAHIREIERILDIAIAAQKDDRF